MNTKAGGKVSEKESRKNIYLQLLEWEDKKPEQLIWSKNKDLSLSKYAWNC